MQSSNWLDRTISWFAPEVGLRRARARALAALASTARLSYDGAKTGRLTAGWLSSGNSANTEIAVDLKLLRERSRDLIRNNHFAAKAALEFGAKTVGTGITARWQDPGVQALWDHWTRECSADSLPTIGSVQALAARMVFESGECLIRRRTRTQTVAAGMSVPIQLQLLEPDYLDLSKTETLRDGSGYIIQGVEFNSWGQRVAYWLFPQHPGEVVITNYARALQSNRVPATEVLHIFDWTTIRGGQVRGVPHLHPVMLTMRDLDDWEHAEILRKKTEACLAAIIESPEDTNIGPQTTTTMTVPTTTGNTDITVLAEQLAPGMIARIRPGEEIKFNTPAYAGGYEEYKRSRVRDFATGIGMLYEILAGDLSQTNYSSYRSGLLAYRDRVESLQWNVFVPMCDRIATWFIAAAQDFADLPAREDGYGVQWGPPPFDLLDREAEAKADQLELQIGKRTWPQMVSAQGEDPEKQIAEITAWKPRLDAAGVTFNPKVQPDANNQTPQPQN